MFSCLLVIHSALLQVSKWRGPTFQRGSLAKRSLFNVTLLVPTTCSFNEIVDSFMNIEASNKCLGSLEEIQVQTCRHKPLK